MVPWTDACVSLRGVPAYVCRAERYVRPWPRARSNADATSPDVCGLTPPDVCAAAAAPPVAVSVAESSSASVMSNISAPSWSERVPSDQRTTRAFDCLICGRVRGWRQSRGTRSRRSDRAQERERRTHDLVELVLGPPPPDHVLVRDRAGLDVVAGVLAVLLARGERVLGLPRRLVERRRRDLEEVGHARVPHLAAGGHAKVGERDLRNHLLVVHHLRRGLLVVVVLGVGRALVVLEVGARAALLAREAVRGRAGAVVGVGGVCGLRRGGLGVHVPASGR